jgi:DNA-3-methyladenine glycosylase II
MLKRGYPAFDPAGSTLRTKRLPGRCCRSGFASCRPQHSGRKTEYLHAVADAALDGALDGATLRAMDPIDAVEAVRQVKGLGHFAAELVVVRGANAPDALPRNERRLEAEVAERYGSPASLEAAADTWRPFRSWAAVHLRVLREERTDEISGPG